ncbi:hypothetical protein GUITHDRAFT_148938, partial [Guillardia theta CCMP2712]
MRFVLIAVLAFHLLLSCSSSIISSPEARRPSLLHAAGRGLEEASRQAASRPRRRQQKRWKWVLIGAEQEDVFSITLREVQGAAAGAAGAAGAGAGAGAGCTETRKVAGFELRDTMREGWTRCLTATSCSGREVVLSSGRQINVTAFERFVEEELEGKEGHLIVLVDTTSNLLSLSAEIKRRIVKLLCDPSSMVVACLTEDSTRMLVSCEELDAQCVLVAQSPTMFSSLAQFSLLQEETMEWSK